MGFHQFFPQCGGLALMFWEAGIMAEEKIEWDTVDHSRSNFIYVQFLITENL